MSDRLIDLFAQELSVDTSTLDDDSSPDNVESWDSLAAMRLVAAVEEEFEIRLSAGDIMKMQTIGQARDVLKKKKVDI